MSKILTPAEQAACDYVAEDLPKDEGDVPYVYQDSEGYWTIGIGFMVDKRKGGKLYPEEISFILKNRISKIFAGVINEPWYGAVMNDAVRLSAILNMQFQLGSNSDEEFANSFACIGKKDWAGAAKNLRASLWAKQTPTRAARVIDMIESGLRTA